MKQNLWTKKYADWTLKDGVIVALISGMLCMLPMGAIGIYDKIHRNKLKY